MVLSQITKIAIVSTIVLLSTINATSSPDELKSRLAALDSQIDNVEAKLSAIENLKMYQQKAKVSKLNQGHLDELSNIYKHTLH